MLAINSISSAALSLLYLEGLHRPSLLQSMAAYGVLEQCARTMVRASEASDSSAQPEALRAILAACSIFLTDLWDEKHPLTSLVCHANCAIAAQRSILSGPNL